MGKHQTPLIFLDIDGVLNSHLFYDSDRSVNRKYDIDSESVKVLNTLFDKVEELPKVVISSTWRLNHTVEEFEEIFKEYDFKGEIIGKTPDMRFGEHSSAILRGNEILSWMQHNPEILGTTYWEFNRYVIFDDDSDMLYWQRNNFIHVDPHCGITNRNIFHAKKILGLHEPYEGPL